MARLLPAHPIQRADLPHRQPLAPEAFPSRLRRRRRANIALGDPRCRRRVPRCRSGDTAPQRARYLKRARRRSRAARHAIRTRRCAEESGAPFTTAVRQRGAFEQEPAIGPGPDQARQPPRHGLDLIAPSRRENGHLLAGVLMTIGALYFSREFLVPVVRRRAPDLRPQPDRPRVRASAAGGSAAVVLAGRARVRRSWAASPGAGDPGRRPRRRDSDLPTTSLAQDRGDPWMSRGNVIEKLSRRRAPAECRRRAPEGRQAGRARPEKPLPSWW